MSSETTKTEEDLLEEQAQQVLANAKKEAKELREKKKAIRNKKLVDLGTIALQFLQGTVSKDELEKVAVDTKLLIIKNGGDDALADTTN